MRTDFLKTLLVALTGIIFSIVITGCSSESNIENNHIGQEVKIFYMAHKPGKGAVLLDYKTLVTDLKTNTDDMKHKIENNIYEHISESDKNSVYNFIEIVDEMFMELEKDNQPNHYVPLNRLEDNLGTSRLIQYTQEMTKSIDNPKYKSEEQKPDKHLDEDWEHIMLIVEALSTPIIIN